jgi:hypothetical protein
MQPAIGLPQGNERVLEIEYETLDGTLWRTGFERDYGLLICSLCLAFVRHTVQDTQWFSI